MARQSDADRMAVRIIKIFMIFDFQPVVCVNLNKSHYEETTKLEEDEFRFR